MRLTNKKILYLKKFLNSAKFKASSSNNYSEYWKEFANEMKIDFKPNNEVIVYGGTKGASLYFNKFTLLKNLFFHNSFNDSLKLLFKYFYNKLFAFKKSRLIKHLTWAQGFDAVMQNDKLIQHVLSEHYINHIELKNKFKNIYKSSKEVINDYKNWGSMKITEKMFIHYYNFNLLHPYLSKQKKDFQSTFMDIGGGNGLLASILSKKHKPKNMILIDLPQTLINSYCYLANCFSENDIYLPTEFNSKKDLENKIEKANGIGTSFFLLTPEQISFLPSNFVDLSINSTSFQEMNYEQIEEYFNLIDRVSKNKSLFYCVNRVQKLTYGDDSSRYKRKPLIFYEYPWNKNNKLLIDEVSRLYNACQYEPAAIRLQEIVK